MSIAVSGVERIAHAFAAAPGRAAFMPYLMGGFPTIEGSRRVGEAYAQGGADLVERGVPFSDPLADGPVVHAAGTAALRAGASGLIVPDLPLEEAPAVLEACDAAGVALVPLVAPTTPEDRLAAIGARARGFVYTVSVTGTTGERAALADAYADVIVRAKAATSVPVALGFGIATPEQALHAAAAGADGVIVGSRLVRAAAESGGDPEPIRALVAEFATALRAGVE